jgi:para-nitrobenzyl esterase
LANLHTFAADPDPVAAVTGGSIRGRLLPEGRGSVFRGIPFAQAPVGDLRWHEPMPVIPWTGIRDAGEAGPPPAQIAYGWNNKFASAASEDCLYLDVWTPAKPSFQTRYPVMVWIHGGGNTSGAGGSDPAFDGTALISHCVILVVIEYRVGIFAFFAHPELSRESPHRACGNYGILDQIAALQWVRDNIAKFGGDPENVTLFGQSAGAVDVLAQMTSPLSQGLFHRAIAESGEPTAAMTQPLDEAEQAGMRAVEKLHVPAQNALAYLRSLPTAEILKIEPGKISFVADGWVFPTASAEVLAAGRARAMPLIIGNNAFESPFMGSVDDIRNSMRKTFKDQAPKALALYGLADDTPGAIDDPLFGNLAEQWGTDLLRCPAVVQGERHNASGNSVWEYEFDRALPPHPRVGHSGELPYVFGNFRAKDGNGAAIQDADRRLSATIQGYWTNFAKTGNPNGPGLPFWPTYDGKARKYLTFTTTADVTVKDNQRGPFCDLFREAMAKPAAQVH